MKQVTPIFRGVPTNGVMNITNIGQWTRYMKTLEGVDCEIKVTKYRRRRSNPQNAYFHGVVCVLLGEHWGYTTEEAKSAIKGEFLKVYPENKPPYTRSTADLNTEEFNQFLEAVKIWAADEWNVYIPDPEKAE